MQPDEESELSKLFLLGFLMLALGGVQLAFFQLACYFFGTIGGALAVAALVAGWAWLLDYSPGIDYYRKRYNLEP